MRVGVSVELILVHAHVPVGELLDHVHQPRHDRVQAVGLHLLPHEGEKAVGRGEDPTVHRVGRREGARGILTERHARLELLSGGAPG